MNPMPWEGSKNSDTACHCWWTGRRSQGGGHLIVSRLEARKWKIRLTKCLPPLFYPCQYRVGYPPTCTGTWKPQLFQKVFAVAGHRGSGYISHFGTLRKMMGKLICRDKQNKYPFPLQLRIPVLILPKASIRFKCPVAPKYSVDFRDPNSPSSEGSIKAQT